MVSLFTTVVLLFVTLGLTSCQRKLSRNIALGTEIKTSVNFDCPEEFGYYPHPNDCTQYYVCVFGGALLESCTGGLMYSHELQTCDWPRNVGCDGEADASSTQSPGQKKFGRDRDRDESKSKYSSTLSSPQPRPPPIAVVTSRGQPRQLHHSNQQQQLLKQQQQQQLYAETEDSLPPADEIENDRQQRVYRGQPSTIGQVQRDRDGLRHTNAIPTYNGRSEKIGVISFGTQQHYSKKTDDDYDTLTNNKLFLKRRRKRQTFSSLQPKSDGWHTPNTKTSFNRHFPVSSLTPPTLNKHTNYQLHYLNTQKEPSSDEFQPFIPIYQSTQYLPYTPLKNQRYLNKEGLRKSPNNIKGNQTNFSYINFAPTSIPYNKNIAESNSQINIKLYSDATVPQEHYRTPNRTDKFITEAMTLKYNSLSEPTIHYKQFPPHREYYDYDDDSYYTPTTTKNFNTKNKYEHIDNPFAHHDFDFDKFLENLKLPIGKSTEPPKLTTESNKSKNLLQINKNNYKEYIQTTRAPINKIVSSQANSDLNNYNNTNTINLVASQPNVEYEYYYDYDDDDENVDNKEKSVLQYNNPKNNTNKSNVPTKYSAKYQEAPKISPKNTTYRPVPFKTNDYSAVFNSNKTAHVTNPTTPRTVRQRSKTTPTSRSSSIKLEKGRTKQRHTNSTQSLHSNDWHKRKQSKLTESDSNVSPPSQLAISTATATPRTVYNTTEYNNNHYDPYYALYDDDDVELFRDVDYSHNNNYNNNNNNNNNQHSQQPPYKGISTSAAVQPTSSHDDSLKRNNAVYLQNNYNQPDIYSASTVSDYNEDNLYSGQVHDQSSYKQTSKQPSRLRGDRNELNEVEETTNKRTTSSSRKLSPPTTTISTIRVTSTRINTFRSTTTAPLKKNPPQTSRTSVTAKENQTQAIINTVPEDRGRTTRTTSVAPLEEPIIPFLSTDNFIYRQDDIIETKPLPITYRPKILDSIPDFSLHEPYRAAITRKPAPFSISPHLVSDKNSKSSKYIIVKQINDLSSSNNDNATLFDYEVNDSNPVIYSTSSKVIIPTTYSPPKFFLKSILPNRVLTNSRVFSFKSPINKTTNNSEEFVIGNKSTPQIINKTLKAVRKIVHPIAVDNQHKIEIKSDLQDELIPETTSLQPNFNINESKILENIVNSVTLTKPVSTTVISTFPESSETFEPHNEYILKRLQSYFENEKTHYQSKPDGSQKYYNFRTTIEIPPAHEIADAGDIIDKPEPDRLPSYKPMPILPILQNTATRTDVPQNTSHPTRVSRVNAAIKSLIAIGGTQKQTLKCHENQTPKTKCNGSKQRNSLRGRGSTHYSGSGGNIANNEVIINTNRGTPVPRLRPTLKPSTSIVSKASEFIDIYRYPPRRPDPIYPQPQPDKTAAKCRKDVCLLPDCSCGGKEIPGNLPPEEVPQMVLLTFDDAVNDLNKQYYIDLFENGRHNPNGCPILSTFYVSHEWTDYSQVQNLYADGHEMASHTVSHSFGEQFSQKKWTREVAGQREILSAYGGVHLEDVRGMRAPFLSVGGNKMFKMLYDSNFTYDSSMPIYENKPPSWPYTLDYKLFHDCMIPPCPTRSYPGVWEVPMVMWQDLNGGRCSMGDACSNPPDADGVMKMLMKNFQRHYTSNRAPFGLFYHAAWFTQPHHKEGFINFIDTILSMKDVWLVTNWQALQWVRNPTPTTRLDSFQPFQCDFSDRPKRCNNPKVCNLWHKSGVRYMRTCQPCPDIYPWTGNTGIRSSKIDNDIED